MDAVRPGAQELSAASRWSGHTSPHELAEALSLILPLLPLDARARAACVCRAWRTATSNPLLWEELRFAHCAAHVRDATLARLCARAGTALRTLDLDADACTHITAAGVLAALRGGGCTGVRHLNMPERPRRLNSESCSPLKWSSSWLLRVRRCSVRRVRRVAGSQRW